MIVLTPQEQEQLALVRELLTDARQAHKFDSVHLLLLKALQAAEDQFDFELKGIEATIDGFEMGIVVLKREKDKAKQIAESARAATKRAEDEARRLRVQLQESRDQNRELAFLAGRLQNRLDELEPPPERKSDDNDAARG